jgi:hypothetical protein
MTPRRAALFTKTRMLVEEFRREAEVIYKFDPDAACLGIVYETFACDAEAAMKLLADTEAADKAGEPRVTK